MYTIRVSVRLDCGTREGRSGHILVGTDALISTDDDNLALVIFMSRHDEEVRIAYSLYVVATLT
jgi:hypothetical protein